jgi:hypothetical protein
MLVLASMAAAWFFVTMVYELHPQTDPDAAKLLRAELVGRRWQDRHEGERMPSNAVWMKRSVEEKQSTDDARDASVADLRKAVAAVAGMGRKIALVRAWVQVTGSGTMGVVPGTPPVT